MATATLYCKLYIECPSCNESFDLFKDNRDDDGVYSIPVFNNEWDDVVGYDEDCPHCGYNIIIDGIEV